MDGEKKGDVATSSTLPPVTDPVSLCCDFTEAPVTITIKGVATKYFLRELDGKERDDHLNDQLARQRRGPDGRAVGVETLTDYQASLIALCLYDKDGKRVPIELIRSWPARVQEELYARAQRLSALDRATARLDAKNASAANAGTGTASPPA